MRGSAQPEPGGLRAVVFKNNSGETVPKFGVIKITGTTAVNSQIMFLGDQPDTWGSQYRHYINGPEDVGNGKYGVCYVPTSPVWALYDTGDTPSVGESWGPTNASWELSQHVGGFEICGADTKDGAVLVVQRPMLWFLGKTDASHAKGATGTVSIWSGATVGSESDTTVNKTGVYNRFAALETGKWVHCRWIKDDDFEFDAGEC